MALSNTKEATSEYVPRKLDGVSWIDAFIASTDNTQSPIIFRRWAAIAGIAGVLERKVWLRAFGRTLYPNQYILLVGPPGVGKTDAIRPLFDFAEDVRDWHLAPSNVSAPSLIDSLNEAKRIILRPTEAVTMHAFNALTVASDEFGVFLKEYDNSFMSNLNKLYDGTIYTEKKRGLKHEIKIDKPTLNIIAGTTPGWLGKNLPATAWVEGFASRLIIIYSGDRVKLDPFASEAYKPAEQAALLSDLQQMHGLFGQFVWDEDVADCFKAWYMADCPPKPDHPKLEHYLPRRHVHFMKLMMVMSVARSDELVLRMDDYQEAMNALLEAEAFMPDVFKSMSMSLDANIMDETYAFIYNAWIKENKAVLGTRIIHFIGQRVPSHSVIRTLEVMTQSNMIKIAAPGGRPELNTYQPVNKIEHGR